MAGSSRVGKGHGRMLLVLLVCLSKPGACLGHGVSAQVVQCQHFVPGFTLDFRSSCFDAPGACGAAMLLLGVCPYPGAPELTSSQRGLVSPVHSWRHLEDFNKLLFGIELGWGTFTSDFWVAVLSLEPVWLRSKADVPPPAWVQHGELEPCRWPGRCVPVAVLDAGGPGRRAAVGPVPSRHEQSLRLADPTSPPRQWVPLRELHGACCACSHRGSLCLCAPALVFSIATASEGRSKKRSCLKKLG